MGSHQQRPVADAGGGGAADLAAAPGIASLTSGGRGGDASADGESRDCAEADGREAGTSGKRPQHVGNGGGGEERGGGGSGSVGTGETEMEGRGAASSPIVASRGGRPVSPTSPLLSPPSTSSSGGQRQQQPRQQQQQQPASPALPFLRSGGPHREGRGGGQPQRRPRPHHPKSPSSPGFRRMMDRSSSAGLGLSVGVEKLGVGDLDGSPLLPSLEDEMAAAAAAARPSPEQEEEDLGEDLETVGSDSGSVGSPSSLSAEEDCASVTNNDSPADDGGLAGDAAAGQRPAAAAPSTSSAFSYCRRRRRVTRTMGSFAVWSFGGSGSGQEDEDEDEDTMHVRQSLAPIANSDGTDVNGSGMATATTKQQQLQSQSHDPLILFGLDISDLPPNVQFFVCACGVFAFTIIYGYLQELLAVRIAGRKFGLFLATAQFSGYAFWSFVLTRIRTYRHRRRWRRLRYDGRRHLGHEHGSDPNLAASATAADRPRSPQRGSTDAAAAAVWTAGSSSTVPVPVPLRIFVGLSLIRAIDLGMTNLAMQFLNYPAKTLIKSSRVVFTMILGLLIGRKRYKVRDYVAVSLLVVGLGIFLHADSRSSVVFHPLGVLMLVVSLTCDGTLNNWSEVIMREYRIGQDEFQLRLYSIALLAMTIAAHLKGELILGIRYFMLTPGTVTEIESGRFDHDPATWTVMRKINILILFSTTGLLGSSCAGAITKRFGALSMSITSTVRKAMTLFLSFVAFPNKCTVEHVAGMTIFLSALLMKSLWAHRANVAGGEVKVGAGSAVDGGAGMQQLQDSPSAMELDKLSHQEEERVPLAAAAEDFAAMVNDMACASKEMSANDDIESGPIDDEHERLLNDGEARVSLYETARRSPKLTSLFSYLPRLKRSMQSTPSHDSHSS